MRAKRVEMAPNAVRDLNALGVWGVGERSEMLARSALEEARRKAVPPRLSQRQPFRRSGLLLLQPPASPIVTGYALSCDQAAAHPSTARALAVSHRSTMRRAPGAYSGQEAVPLRRGLEPGTKPAPGFSSNGALVSPSRRYPGNAIANIWQP
jgi:hypothetical protein